MYGGRERAARSRVFSVISLVNDVKALLIITTWRARSGKGVNENLRQGSRLGETGGRVRGRVTGSAIWWRFWENEVNRGECRSKVKPYDLW